MTNEEMAKSFHEAYERLAPEFGYKTREASAVPWERVPESNRRLMVAAAARVCAALASEPEPLAVVDRWLSVCTKDRETAKNAALKPDRLTATDISHTKDWVSIPVTVIITEGSHD